MDSSRPLNGRASSNERRENVLLIRFKSIGDVVFTLPAVHALRRNFPGAKITFLTSREHASLIRGFQDVDEVIAVDRKRFSSGNPLAIIHEMFSLLRRLRREKFTLAVDLQGYGETALLTWLSGAPRRWGSVYQPARRWAYNRWAARDIKLHTVDWNLSLLRQCGLPVGEIVNRFVLPPDALDEARQLFLKFGLDPEKRTLVFQPRTSAAYKNWPVENYLAVAKHFRSAGLQVLFCGGPSDSITLEPARQAGFPVSVGASLLATAGLMKLATLTVGSDTGMVHLTVAMGKQVLMLLPPNTVNDVRPYQHPDWVVATSGNSIAQIGAESVITACDNALAALAGHDASGEPASS